MSGDFKDVKFFSIYKGKGIRMRFGKRQMKDNVIDLNNLLDAKIYRIFRINRFMELINENKLVLVNPYMWDDPFENFFLKANGKDESGNLVSFKNIADKWYGQCWTLTEESDAMWRIYSPEKDGVRVSTTGRKLFSCLWNPKDNFSGLKYFIGKVSYRPRNEIEEFMCNTNFRNIAAGDQNDGFAKLLCIKRPEFSHETEVRILANDTDGTVGVNGCYPITFDYQNILDDICLDPRLDANLCKCIIDCIKKAGCTLPIKQSDLYKVDLSPIPLQ